ncbi:hypothetical protein BROUX41_003779 [Berkeleyomyces rouxiae]|uniref:uncharacterized protein n=1 Tax=Berkeleyomyces rouxiae TaxID=2035830 RepID=UPI003B75F687
MAGGLFLLLSLSVIMAVTSFVAGVLPLTMTLSQSQLRLITSIGVGILVGTSMTVIIPEGVEALTLHAHSHADPAPSAVGAERRSPSEPGFVHLLAVPELQVEPNSAAGGTSRPDVLSEISRTLARREADDNELPTFSIGFSLISGFLLMFFIDRLPRHATDHLSASTARDISLDSIGADSSGGAADHESTGFLSALAPNSPYHAGPRSNALTVGLVIHAAADGIAMGASSSTQNTKLGFIIFIAILVHKAPAAFGLTTVLLRQGVSKYAARGHLLVFSLAAPCGAIVTWLLIHLLGGGQGMQGAEGHYWTGMLLLFSAGTFLYVAMHAMQEETHTHESSSGSGYADLPHQRKRPGLQMRDTLATAGGMLLPLLAQIGHGGH